MSTQHAIFTQGLVVRYGQRVGIDGVDLTVPERSLFGFLGPNGAGKTTTIRVLLGFLRANEGGARVLGQDCWKQSHRLKRDVGYVPGDLRLYPWLTAQKAFRILSGVRDADLSRHGYELVDRLRLDPNVRVRKMSRGMRQKLGQVMALVHEPKLLILDEPTTGLDPLTQLELADILRELVHGNGTTVFFSSHTLSEVELLCDHVAIVREGQVVESSTITDLQARARRRIRIEFQSGHDGTSITFPEVLTPVERHATHCIAEFDGSATALTDWLRNEPAIADFTIGPPDLESVFHKYYRNSEQRGESC